MTCVRLCFIQVGGMILNNKASLRLAATVFIQALPGTEVLISRMSYPRWPYTRPETLGKYHVGLKRNHLKSVR